MKKHPFALAILVDSLCAASGQTQPASPALTNLPVRWEEMTAPEFAQAVSRSGATCIIPCGILAGETETSLMMTHRPELAHVDRAKQQGGEDQKRLGLPDVYTAIWWYARFPNHYGGDGSAGTRDLGEALLNRQVDSLVRMISTQ